MLIYSEGEPRFELSLDGEKVDSIRVGRYDLKALRNLLGKLGLARDESYTWEKKAAQIELEKAFGVPHKETKIKLPENNG
jgi:hypothetical protein